MKKKRPFMRLWKSDFRDGARMLSRPAKLLYFELIMLLDDHEGVVPDDVKWITRHVGAHDARQIRGPLEELVTEGKLQRTPKGLTNGRVTRDQVDEPPADTEPQSSPATVDNPVKDTGENAEAGDHCAPTAPPLSSHCPQSNSQVFDIAALFRPPIHSHSQYLNHDVAAAESGHRARARGDPVPA